MIFDALIIAVPLHPSSFGFEWTLFAAIAYVTGHGITSLSDRFDKLLPSRFGGGKEGKRDQVKDSGEYILFVETVRSLPQAEALPDELDRAFHTYRNLAMSMAPEEDAKIYRFMFLSLLNGGIAAVLIILAAAWAGAAALPDHIIRPEFPFNVYVAVLLLLGAIFIFRERELYFFRIANQVPFSVAAVKVSQLSNHRSLPEGGAD